MTNNELTLDQLQSISGGATAIEYGLIATRCPRIRSSALNAKCQRPTKSLTTGTPSFVSVNV